MGDYNVDDLREFIIKSLDLYDKNTLKYRKYLNSKVKLPKDNYNKDSNIEFITSDEELTKFSYQILGYYDNINNIWFWGWLLPLNNDETQISRELLYYGLKLDINSVNAEQMYLKGLLLNSRYIVDNKIGLDINLAIFSYILKDKILFIYPIKTEKIIVYYVIYN
jgi:hypothetical protein